MDERLLTPEELNDAVFMDDGEGGLVVKPDAYLEVAKAQLAKVDKLKLDRPKQESLLAEELHHHTDDSKTLTCSIGYLAKHIAQKLGYELPEPPPESILPCKKGHTHKYIKQTKKGLPSLLPFVCVHCGMGSLYREMSWL